MSPWKVPAMVGLIWSAIGATHVVCTATNAAEATFAETQFIEITASETLVIRAGEPSRRRTLVVPTRLSTNRYVESITIDTGDVPAEVVESVWVFGDGLLDHLIDEDEQPGFEGSIESRLTPLGTRVLASPPDGMPETARSAWAWRLPPKHSIAVVVRLPKTEKYQLLKLKFKLKLKNRLFNPSTVLWLAEGTDERTPYHRRVVLARGAQLLTVVSDSSGNLVLKSKPRDESKATSEWPIKTNSSNAFVGTERRIEFGHGVELSLAASNALATEHTEYKSSSATALVLHASDELDRTLLLQDTSRQEWQARLNLCKQDAEQDPRDVVSQFTIGLLQMQQGETNKAISAWREVIDTDADFFYAHYQLARALASTDQTEAAISAYRDAIQLRPTHARAHFGLATILFGQRELRDAMKHLLIAADHENDNAAVHTNLAVLYGLLRDTNKQMEHFRLAVELDPDATGATVGLTQSLAKQGRLPDALRELDLALVRRPHNEMLLLAKARLLTLNDAITAFEAVLRSSPQSIPAMTGLAESLVKRSANDGADLQRGVHLLEYVSEVTAERNPEVLRILAECYIAMGRHSDAADTVGDAIEAAKKVGTDSAMLDALDQLRVRIRKNTPVTQP